MIFVCQRKDIWNFFGSNFKNSLNCITFRTNYFVAPHSLWSMNPHLTEDVHAELGPPYSTVALFVPLLEISLSRVSRRLLGRGAFAIKATYVTMNPSEEWRAVKKDGGHCHPFHTVGHGTPWSRKCDPFWSVLIAADSLLRVLILRVFNHVSVRLWYMWGSFSNGKWRYR